MEPRMEAQDEAQHLFEVREENGIPGDDKTDWENAEWEMAHRDLYRQIQAALQDAGVDIAPDKGYAQRAARAELGSIAQTLRISESELEDIVQAKNSAGMALKFVTFVRKHSLEN